MPLEVDNGLGLARQLALPVFVTPMRSGAHWIRYMLELYSGRPGLKKVYFPELYSLPHPEDPSNEIRAEVVHDTASWTHFWTHDEGICGRSLATPENMIFMVRNPVDTIISQMKFLLMYPSEIWALAREYGRYFKRGLMDCSLVLSYDRLAHDPHAEFEKLCHRLGIPFNLARFNMVYLASGKEMVRARTEPPNKPQQQIVSLYSDEQTAASEALKAQYGAEIIKAVRANIPSQYWQRYSEITKRLPA